MDNEKEIPFGAFDSELMHEEISIPEGFEATIEGNKIILKKIEPEDERIRKYLIRYIDNTMKSSELKSKLLAWLEKQDTPNQTSIWKHWKDGIAGNGEGKPIYLIKYGRIYSLSSYLCFECDYIELSELDKLMLEKQGEQKPQRMISAEAKEALYDKPDWSDEDE